MKKVLALGLVSLALVQAKVFLGVQGGYDLGVGLTKTGTLDAPIWKGATTGGWSAGANLGLEHGEGFFGVRYFLSFDYSAPLANSNVYSKLNVFDVDLNLDMLLNRAWRRIWFWTILRCWCRLSICVLHRLKECAVRFRRRAYLR